FFLGGPAIQRVIWRVSGGEEVTVNQLVAGEADATETVFNPAALDLLDQQDGLRLQPYPAPAYGYIAFNFVDPTDQSAPHPLFTDRSIRRAIATAINRSDILSAVFGNRGYEPIGATGRAVWIWTDSIAQLPYDTAAARALLDGAGWVDSDGDGIRDLAGRPLSFRLLVPSSSGARRQSAVIVQEQLARIGVEVSISELEFNTFLERALQGDFDAVFGAFALDPSPRGITQLWTEQGIGSNNWGRYSNDQVNELVLHALRAPDVETSTRRWHEVLVALNDDVPAVWLFEPRLTAVIASRFSGVVLRPDQWASNIWRWTVN
ncbi:MAG: ABC transporter substrate-binding protein, partial [Gemmatimonadales bacterium]